MANTSGLLNSFKLDLLNGKHAFGASVIRAATTADSFKGALYLASGSLAPATTTAYSAISEVSGTGYTATGTAITNATAPAIVTNTACWTPSANITWTTVTLATAFDTLLIYNDTAVGKNGVGLFNFGSQTISAGNFSLVVPANTDTTALVRIA